MDKQKGNYEKEREEILKEFFTQFKKNELTLQSKED
jgi:hypothetical protein